MEQYTGLVEKNKITGEKTWLSTFTVKRTTISKVSGSLVRKKKHVTYLNKILDLGPMQDDSQLKSEEGKKSKRSRTCADLQQKGISRKI